MSLTKMCRALSVAIALFVLGMPAQAGMVSTAEIQAAAAAIDHRDVVDRRAWIESQLVQGGVPAEEAALRANALTDAEVAQIYQRIDEAPAGGASVLLIALVIFAVLELTGYINVIPDK